MYLKNTEGYLTTLIFKITFTDMYGVSLIFQCLIHLKEVHGGLKTWLCTSLLLLQSTHIATYNPL